MKKYVSIFLLLICGLFNVYAQSLEHESTEKADQFRNSFSFGMFIVFGNIQLNYERLLSPNHGLVVEGFYDSDAPGLQTWTAGVEYRYHFRNSLKGPFARVFYRTGEVEQLFDIDDMDFQMNTRLNVLGLGAGYRWQWAKGFAIVARAGYGYQIAEKHDWIPGEPTNSQMKNITEALQGMDLELGIGYSF